MKTRAGFLPKPDALHGVFVLACLVFLYLTYNEGLVNILKWDLFGHYAYLPMVFQTGELAPHDLTYFETVNTTYQNTPYMYQFVLLDNGVYITKYSSGWAVLLSPFYLIADFWAANSSYAKDGFSYPYQVMMSAGCSFYICCGLWFLQKILRYFFQLRVAILTFCLLIFGTNWLFMNYAALGSSNNIEFFLVAWMLWMTVRFHESFSWKYAFGLGISIGFIGLVRPPDLILTLIPVFWNTKTYGGILAKIKYFWREKMALSLIALLPAIAILLIQLGYWKITSGHFLMNSYANNAGEGFDWFTPYLLEVLFSFRKGWFIYTPLMLFAVAGLYLWTKKTASHGLAPMLIFILFLYVISCWTCWYYAESFSQRALLDAYPLLAIGLGFILQQWWENRKSWLLGIMLLLAGFNMFQSYQMQKGIIHGSRMTAAYYFSIFGQITPPTAQQNDLLLIDRNLGITGGFTETDKYKTCYEKRIVFPSGTELNASNIYSPIVEILPDEITEKDHFWTRITWKYEGNTQELRGKVFNGTALYKSKAYQYIGQEIGHPLLHLDSINHEVSFEYISPEMRSHKDPLRFGVWHQSGLPLKLISAHIVCFDRKD